MGFNQNIGIILLGWFIIIFAIVNSIMGGIGIFLYLTNPSENISLILTMLRLGYGIMFFVLGTGILKLQLWARLTVLVIASVFLTFDCIKLILTVASQQLSYKVTFLLISLCINLIIIYSLNRPKIKEQFTHNPKFQGHNT